MAINLYKNGEKNCWGMVALALLCVSCLGYNFIPHTGPEAFFPLWGLYSVQFLLLGAIVVCHRKHPLSFLSVLITAILCRVLILPSDPIFENDYWRYMWDGHVFAHDINPFRYAPNAKALDWISTEYRDNIGWKHYATIYPPFSQYVFGFTHVIAPDSVLGLKLVLIGFDLATGVLLAKWLQTLCRPPGWSLLYLLNPLVFKEIANSAHLDSIVVFMTLLSCWFLYRKRHELGWVALACATCAKVYPLILIPFFIKMDKKWRLHLLLYVTVVLVLYLPFLDAGGMLFNGTRAYAKYWIFNASVFQVTNNIVLSIFDLDTAHGWLRNALAKDYFSKALMGIFFLVGVFYRLRFPQTEKDIASAALWTIGLVLILSPVVDTWYVLWVLPFAILQRNRAWIIFSYLSFLSYAWFYSKAQAPYFRTLEYVLFYGLLLYPFAWPRLKAIAK